MDPRLTHPKSDLACRKRRLVDTLDKGGNEEISFRLRWSVWMDGRSSELVNAQPVIGAITH